MAATQHDRLEDDSALPYEAPELTDYGTIEAWTRGVRQLIQISIVL